MNRVINYQIDEENDGKTIARFLTDRQYSRQCLIRLKKTTDGILLNDEWAYVKAVLHTGDELKIQVQEEEDDNILPTVLPFPIIYEDEDLVVVDKPAGMPIHPSLKHYEHTLANAFAWYYQERGSKPVFRCINRLDRDTSGLTMIAKNYVSGAILYQEMMDRMIHREYLAVVEGADIEESGTVTLPIGRKNDSIIERVIDFEHGETAVTHYRVIKRMTDTTLLSLHLDTGRTHQIRVHMCAIGHPLVGDFLYNPGNHRMNRQALHSYRLSFTHPINGNIMEFTAPIPNDMKVIIE